MNAEQERLEEARAHKKHWKQWGPYLSERAWGTVREDYSANGTAWEYFPHDHARSRAYRWNEDGIAGICDRHQRICFALALWNGRDPILKERLFGLTGNEGNHGEDVKENYFYLDSTPTHSYMKYLYKYPQAEFPYTKLVEVNRQRGKDKPEFELLDTGVFDQDRYFDVFVEYAKAGPEDICIRITAINRGPEAAPLHLLPTVWFRNTWSWGHAPNKPMLDAMMPGCDGMLVHYPSLVDRILYCEGGPELLFTENETNLHRLFGTEIRSKADPSGMTTPRDPSGMTALADRSGLTPQADHSGVKTPYVKDAFHEYLIHGNQGVVNPGQSGTKAAAHYPLTIGPGESAVVRLRLTDSGQSGADKPSKKGKAGVTPPPSHPLTVSPLADIDAIFESRIREADEFYSTVIPEELSDDAKSVMRQALAGLMWSKQFYHYVVEEWLDGDRGEPAPPEARKHGRNSHWRHLYNSDVLSMPDKWEYPWYAAWDLAFHCVPIALIDPDFAKEQLVLLLREWYMHPNGQLPAYEWAFDDVNPPVHAWAALRVYQIERKRRGDGDRNFLERVFHKLMLNFTWWVNRKDAAGMNIFQGGFLGMDNIGVFDRSAALPTGGYLEQSDGTSWMAMYTLNMLAIAFELSREDPVYEDVASKFWEHFLHIAHAMNDLGRVGYELWDEEDGFFYDYLCLGEDNRFPLRVRSMVGLIPLLAVETLDSDQLDRMPGFKERMQWFLDNRPDLTGNVASMVNRGMAERRLFSIVDRDQLRRVLHYMLDENEFLAPNGIRSVSRFHKDHPFTLHLDGHDYSVDYEPGESTTTLFGGNSNWRGPIWWPINYLLVEALQKYHFYFGDDFLVEYPTGSGAMLNLWEISLELSRRLTRTFLADSSGRRPVYGDIEKFRADPHWRDLICFHEYFHGDTGAGLGASHQTGWTGLVAKMLQQSGE